MTCRSPSATAAIGPRASAANAATLPRNLTIQLDEATIRQARVVAAHRGMSLSSLVAQQLTELAAADERYERARGVALGALAEAAAGGAPAWRREELYER
jgi:hypothetical protein